MVRTFLICFIFIGVPLGASERLDAARTTLQEWVAVEKSISKEQNDWRLKEATLLDLIGVLEKESELLVEQNELAQVKLTTADGRRGELLEKESELLGHHEAIDAFLAKMEGEIREMRTQFPQPLSDKLDPFFQRLPKDSSNTTLGIAERMQTVVAVLSEVQKFDGVMTLSQELRELADGDLGEVRTLYLGLASAYYLSPEGGDAGVGYPSDAGWLWESRPELADTIEEAIAIYEGKVQEARFLPLPVSVKGVR